MGQSRLISSDECFATISNFLYNKMRRGVRKKFEKAQIGKLWLKV